MNKRFLWPESTPEVGGGTLITEQGAEISPLEMLRRYQAGEPIRGNSYADYDGDDDDPDYYDPTNSFGVELEDAGVIGDLRDSVVASIKERRETKRRKSTAEEGGMSTSLSQPPPTGVGVVGAINDPPSP